MPIGSKEDERLIQKMNKKATGINNEEKIIEELDSTKIGSMNKKVVGESSNKGQLKAFLNIVPDEEGEVNYEVLDKRYPNVDWESNFYHTDRYGKPHDYYRVFRADGSSRYIKTFTEMVSRFDRLDFIELHSLVMQRFETTTPEGIDLVLWGVHTLMLEDGTEFYMLVERRYPLTKETLERMLALRLIVEYESEAVFDLLRFIQKQIDELKNGPQFTMSNRHQELASLKQTASGKDFLNSFMADINLDLSRLATTLNMLERSIQIGINTVSLNTFSRYGYTYLKEIVLRRVDYKEYKISKADFKNLRPNDFEDLHLPYLQGKLNHLSGADKVSLFNTVYLWIRNIVIRHRVEDLQLFIESYQTKLNLTQPSWDASDFQFKEDYTMVHKPRAIIYKDRNNQKKTMRETMVHKWYLGVSAASFGY
ncbi:hypothetical protein Tco_1435678 [Tanacetum coccineum]